jgi:hypothetical protein
LSEGKSIGETCGILLEEYEVEIERLEQDIFTLLESLESRHLVGIQ